MEPWSPIIVVMEPKASLDLEPKQKCCFGLNGALEHLRYVDLAKPKSGAHSVFFLFIAGTCLFFKVIAKKKRRRGVGANVNDHIFS